LNTNISYSFTFT